MVAYLPGGAPPSAPAAPVVKLHITAPLNHSLYFLNPDTPPGLAVLALRAAGAPEVDWYVDGQLFGSAAAGETVQWPAAAGRHVFEAVNPFTQVKSRPVEVYVQ
jgi:membrane carboxypeptidase/penicillin-binding protein PbpC